MMTRNHFLVIVGLAVAALAPQIAFSQSTNATLPKEWADQVPWRSIGPASMMGRITSIAVYEKDSSIWWAASASGGLLKTTNNGVTFEHQFDREATVSIGDVQVAQSDPNIVWVGTGEANPRNSVSWGDGVYKSTDGGKTWANMGLKKTYQIGRIAIHPENPDIVYVGALGRLWGQNEDRGLFKTIDGGKTWEKILYVDDKTGVIDVQLNPKNPDRMVVATYERARDGFDGNDPIKKYGEGSGIYVSEDAGKTFERCSVGLPACKMGRIGLDYFHKSPDFVYAIIESEMISKEPENSPLAGLRAEDADAGARVTDVTKDGPAEKAGVKVGDIILNFNGETVLTNQQLQAAIRRKKADDKVKMKIARENQVVESEITLAKKPTGRGSQNPFTGTLGGQAENLQDQQGDKGHEYGGVYMSRDGGKAWERINSLNPRPMYYSQIRVDPQDRNYVYVLGTDLYRSKDGGKTFTNDGGSDGIHVDHHAMWVDTRDPRHMILGNDGGLYVTWDRMEHWDHHSHVAIGQFYHVGIDTQRDYMVYGGLQDNGSWGGPSRSGRGAGPVNTDWFRVGGGDGFVTLVDPKDPDQIYFESQNGGMGRINLRTGERGFIRPRPQRGTTYRFDWKTPFILSPHNSGIFYSAGNYVFRSVKKGDEIRAISPEITNSNSGAGSALSESPLQEGLIYVGTNDGAIWVTKDGGQKWDPIYSKKLDLGRTSVSSNEPESGGGRPSGGDRPEGEQPATEEPGQERPTAEAGPEVPTLTKLNDQDAITGAWTAKPSGENAPRGPFGEFAFYLQLKDDGTLTGVSESRNRRTEIKNGKFDAATGDCSWETESQRGVSKVTAKLADGVLTGAIEGGGGRFRIEFRAERKPDPSDHDSGLYSVSSAEPSGRSAADGVAGTWKANAENENFPDGHLDFEIQLDVNDKGEISGRIVSPMGELNITEGKYLADTKKVEFIGESDDFVVEFKADVNGAKLSGNMMARGMDAEIPFTAEQQPQSESDAKPAETPAEKPVESTDQPAKETTQEPEHAAPAEGEQRRPGRRDRARSQEPAAEQRPDTQSSEPAAQPATPESAGQQPSPSDQPLPAETKPQDPISGSWKGSFQAEQMPRGMGEWTLDLKLGDENKVTGAMSSPRGDNEISDGKWDPEKKSLELAIETGRFAMSFKATVQGEKMTGDVDMGGGQFQMQFEATRTSTESSAAGAQTAGDRPPGKKLEELIPGPRWVSALEASRYRPGRCYLTLDGHRSDDDEPYVFVSEDFGATWVSIRGNLPSSAGSTRVIREDIKNENVLYLGCEFGAWVSIDRGTSWTKFGGLPTVAVHDFAQHPTAGEIVAATHGRSLWVGDVSALRQISPATIAAKSTLYQPQEVIRWQSEVSAAESGTRRFVGRNPTSTAKIAYSLGANAQQLELSITDAMGNVVRRFDDASLERGLHVIEWDFRPTPTNQQARAGAAGGGGRGGQGRGGGGGGPGGFGGRGGRFAGGSLLGSYMVTLRVDGEVQTKLLKVSPDPDLPADAVPEAMEEFEILGDERSLEDEIWDFLLGF